MKKKFSIAMSFAVIWGGAFTSLALAAQPAHVLFTTDAPCPVTVPVLSYTDLTNQSGQAASGSTPWTLDTFPSTSVTFFYPASVNCGGTIYNFVSVSPGGPLISGAENVTTTVTGHYALPDTTPPTIAPHGDETVEATSALGAIVNYTAPATSDAVDGAGTATCTPASGSQFALGNTTVTCDASDVAGNHAAQTSFVVHVIDTTPPTIAPHGDETAEATSALGAIVNYNAPATSDTVDGAGTASCSPASGNTFALGNTTITCNKTDAHGNSATTTTFVVHVVDTTPVTVTVPPNMTVEATGPSGALVTFSASASDFVDGALTPTCVPDSGSTFALGTTSVTCSATDAHNNTGSASFNIIVQDTTSPTLTPLSDITVTALNASGVVVNFTASANDLVDGPVAVTCSPISGSLFPIGTTTVNCTATDTHNNTGTGKFNVTVIMDMTPPELTLPSNITVLALNASGAPVNFTASAHDLVDGPVDVTCSPASGSIFPIGTTTINCSATDSHGNKAEGTFTVSVQYATTECQGVAGHQILQPINSDGSSVFKAGSTVPAKFRVCGTDGNPIVTAGVVESFNLIQVISNSTVSDVNEEVDSTTPDTEFRTGNGQWIFNISTKNLDAGNTYIYRITLNDGSNIQFQFSLK